MTTANKIVSGIIVVAVLVVGFVLGSIGGHSQSMSQVVGGTSYDVVNAAGGIRVGMNGTLISTSLQGTCNLVGVATDTIAGGAVVTAKCAATGVRSGDKVRIQLPYTANSTVVVTGATASTTVNDSIRIGLFNASTTVASAVTSIGTSTAWYIIR